MMKKPNEDWILKLKPTTLAAIIADLEGSGETGKGEEIGVQAQRALEDIVGVIEADRMITAAEHL